MLIHCASGPSRVLLDNGAIHTQLLIVIPVVRSQRFSLPRQWYAFACVHVCIHACRFMRVCVHGCMCACVHVCMPICLRSARACACACVCVCVRALSHVWQSRSPPFVQPTSSTHVITRPLEVVKMCCTGSREAASIEAPTRTCMYARQAPVARRASRALQREGG